MEIKEIELPKTFVCSNCGSLPINKFTEGQVVNAIKIKSKKTKCKKCRKTYNKKYYDDNKEKINKRNKVWRTNNKEKAKSNLRNWIDNNEEYVKNRNKEWYEKNREYTKRKRKDRGLQLKSKNVWNNTNFTYDISSFLNKKGIVYFIGDVHKQYIKIGITDNILSLSHRFRSIQGCNPIQLKLYGFIQIDNNRRLERQLHEQFKQYHKVAEWFYYVPEIVRYVETNCMKIELANTIFGETYLSLKDIY